MKRKIGAYLSVSVSLLLCLELFYGRSWAGAADYQLKTSDIKELTEMEKKTFFHAFLPPGQGCSTTAVKAGGTIKILTAAHCFDGPEKKAMMAFDHKEGNRVPMKCKTHPDWKFGEPCTGDIATSPPDVAVCEMESGSVPPPDIKPACVGTKAPTGKGKITLVAAGGQPGKRPPEFFRGTAEVRECKGAEIIMDPVTEPGDSGGFVGSFAANGQFQALGIISGGGNQVSCATDVNIDSVKKFLKEEGLELCEGGGDAGSDPKAGDGSEIPPSPPGVKNDAIPHAMKGERIRETQAEEPIRHSKHPSRRPAINH